MQDNISQHKNQFFHINAYIKGAAIHSGNKSQENIIVSLQAAYI